MPKAPRLFIVVAACLLCTGLLVLVNPIALAEPEAPAQTALSSTVAPQRDAAVIAKQEKRLKRKLTRKRRATWYWQDVMQRKHSHLKRRPAYISSVQYLKHLVKFWHRKHRIAKRRAHHPPHKRQWLCIHRYEGAWNDPNAPYWGGLQMDRNFMRAYGYQLYKTKGTADHWTPLEQMWVAEQALKAGRGFHPWPITARHCGLI